MDPDTFSKIVTVLTEWKSPLTDSAVLNQQTFSPEAISNLDFVNKALAPVTKPELPNISDGNTVFMGDVAAMNVFQPLLASPDNNEQVPMDDDPLESFTFWDGETFYCNQEDLDANCGLSPNLPDDNDMVELQDYLIHDTISGEDLIQLNTDSARNPTLAELNFCSDTLFDCSADNSFLSEDSGYLLSPELLSKSVPINECSNLMNPGALLMSSSGGLYVNNSSTIPSMSIPEAKSSSQSLLSSSCPVTSRTPTGPLYFSPCDERLLLCPQNSPVSDSFVPKRDDTGVEKQIFLPGPSKPVLSSNKRFRTSSSLPVSSPLDVVRAANSPGLKSESPNSSYGSKCTEKSLSGFAELSLSNDDESGSYFDSDHEDEGDDGFSSDEDSYQFENDEMFSTSWPPGKDSKSQSRRNRYFWQYNLQSRGMKTQNLIPLSEEPDPYTLNDVKDPVFSEDCTLPVKHSGKARKGDGNDLTPNPRKLFSIGLELKKLNRLISNLNPAHEYSVNGKPLSRKEKNKLASRVCRLKKKAQHEANKIKLYGLQQEHKRLLTILIDLKRLVVYKIENFQETQNMVLSQKIEDYLNVQEPVKVAGNTTEFVNEVLEKISGGDPDGGLGKL